MDGLDPRKAARKVGLRYIHDDTPGITRRRCGRGFRYVAPSGKPLRNGSHVEWIKSLAIPPAWTDVWIAPDQECHLVATGIDAKGRKQYRYHPEWMEHRNRTKFEGIAGFGEKLPSIRRAVARDLDRGDLSKRHVVASAVRLIDDLLIRVGNEEYAEENDSYGVTTLRCDHVQLNGRCFTLHFRAKGGKERDCICEDRKLLKILRSCEELPGQELFKFRNAAGDVRPIDSSDVNEYLQEISGRSTTAKDFRTWGGTVIAAESFVKAGAATNEDGEMRSKRQLKSVEVAAVRAAAEQLGNTVSTCRQYYVHPDLFEAWKDGRLHAAFEWARENRSPSGLRLAERAVLRLFSQA